LLNGIGLFKFRRIFFGNHGDSHFCNEVAKNNQKTRDRLRFSTTGNVRG
jgi:hypothetical protein